MSGRALARYYDILEGNCRARYLDSKSRFFDESLLPDNQDLRKLHDELMLSVEGIPTSSSGNSLLDLKVVIAEKMLTECRLCERSCGADRKAGKKGHCGVLEPRISSDFIHMGEEPDLVPSYTIFFSGCTFNCVFCQNWDISTKPDSGTLVDPSDLAKSIERKAGYKDHASAVSRVRNVNWVGGDPTSNIPFILDVLSKCNANIPQVWNSNMYLSSDAMRLLAGTIDVYLTDFKYGNDRCALRLSNAPNYMRVVCRNHLEAREDAEMIIRHLVLPGHFRCCTEPVLTWIAENLRDVKVNVMAQYRPEHRARKFPEISRPIKMVEYERALRIAEELQLELCD